MIITGIPTTPTIATEAAHTAYGNSTLPLPTGTILMFGGGSSNVPSGWALCDGSSVPRTGTHIDGKNYSSLSSLYSALSFPYGFGNGSTTFNLPDLRGRIPIGVGVNVANLGSTGGALNHTHVMGDHQHTQSHNHTMNHTHAITNHEHNMSHDHPIGGHTHEMNHRHEVPGHSHNVSGTITYPSHIHIYESHNCPPGSSSTDADIRGSNRNVGDTGTVTRSSGGATSWLYITEGQIGSTSLPDGSSDFWSEQAIGSNNAQAQDSGPSSNNTGPVLNNQNTDGINSSTVDSPSYFGISGTAITDDYTPNTGGMVVSVNTTGSNPPFLTVNFIVKL